MLNVPGECEMRKRCRENSRKGIEHNRERKKAGSSLVQEEYAGTYFTVFNFTTANHNHTASIKEIVSRVSCNESLSNIRDLKANRM